MKIPADPARHHALSTVLRLLDANKQSLEYLFEEWPKPMEERTAVLFDRLEVNLRSVTYDLEELLEDAP